MRQSASFCGHAPSRSNKANKASKVSCLGNVFRGGLLLIDFHQHYH